MPVEITRTEDLSAERLRHLYGWGKDIFGADDLKLQWRPKTLHFLLFDDGELVSHVGVLRHTVSAGGNPVAVGGVGGVVTRPEAQGKGYARTLMRRAAGFFENDWKVEAGLLFCLSRMIPYYEALGWQKIEETVLIEQPEGAIESPMNIMVLPFGGAWPSGAVELESFPW
jgi:GNAT superfamily N-acetyltransferase